MSTDPLPAPVRRLEPEHLVAAVNARTSVGLRLLGSAAAGNVGAAYVRLLDGTEGVLTIGPGSAAEPIRRTGRVLELARDRGIPAPRYLLVVEVADGVAIVQERMPGVVPTRVDSALVAAMVALNERCAGLLAGRAELLDAPDLYLTRSGPGFCLHESLERYDARTRRLLDRVREIGRVYPTRLVGDDLVHLDFHPGNLLVDPAGDPTGPIISGPNISGPNISGIVDWDGIGRGDRRFALVTLAFDLAAPGRDPRLLPRFEDLLRDRLEAETHRTYAAHMSLRLVDWAIRHYAADDVRHWLAVAESQLADSLG